MSKNILGDDAIVVALGSNLPGDYQSSRALLEAALARFQDLGLLISARSAFWRSASWPDRCDPPFVNAVALVDTVLDPQRIMNRLMDLELEFGRRRGGANGPRTLDLDLIAVGRVVIDEPGLILPHPRAHQRGFVMAPLVQVAPEWRHPTLGRTAAELLTTATIAIDAHPL